MAKQIKKIIESEPEPKRKRTRKPKAEPKPEPNTEKVRAEPERELKVFMKHSYLGKNLPPLWQHVRYVLPESQVNQIPKAYYVVIE